MRDESGTISTPHPRAWSGLFHEAHAPQHFAHHAVLRAADPRLFDALHRDLRLRLYDGRPATRCGVRMANMRQGLPPHLGSFFFGLGWFGLVLGLLVGSDLGRAVHQHSGDGGVAQAAVPASNLLAVSHLAAPCAAAALGLVAAGLLLACLSRKHFWLVAQPAGPAGVDLWIAATSWRYESEFAREFASFVERARRLDLELREPGTGLATALDGEPGDAGSAARSPETARLAS